MPLFPPPAAFVILIVVRSAFQLPANSGRKPLPADASRAEGGLVAIGIMRGRLTPPVGGSVQAFPAEHWRSEFQKAKALKLDTIEWILESPLENNPLWTDGGLEQIRSVVSDTSVRVDFVCADYFLESPLVRMSPATVSDNWSVLRRTIDQAARLNASGITIPCVDASAIHSFAEEDELVSALSPCLDYAAERRMGIGLETSLPPRRFRALLKRIGHPALKVTYDIGDGASLGYNPKEEIDAYGPWINNVHVRDRILGGGTVPPGSGSADVPLVLKLLKQSGYAGGFVLQLARGADDVAAARRHLDQLDAWLGEAGYQLRNDGKKNTGSSA
jgi:L-ribulose-5-phosphate 3-epimerase